MRCAPIPAHPPRRRGRPPKTGTPRSSSRLIKDAFPLPHVFRREAPPGRLELAVSAPPMTEAARVWAREQGLAAAEALTSCEGVAVGPPSAWRCRPLSAAGWRRVDPRFAAPWRELTTSP